MKPKNIKSQIREIPNWPASGINFKDITTLLENKKMFKYVINQMAKHYKDKKIDKIVSVEARGFLLGAALAYKLKTGLCLVRKKGKLPYKTLEENYQKEYGKDVLTIHKDTIKKGDRVIIVDDLLATGGTMEAVIKLVERLKGEIIGINVLINLPFLGGSRKLEKYGLNWLVSYGSE